MKRHGSNGEPYEFFKRFTAKYFPGTLSGPFVMPQVSSNHTEETLDDIKGLPNVWFSSGAGEAAAIAYCIKYLGTEKMMYGGDFEYATTFGRIYSYGSSWHALRPTLERDRGYHL